MSAIIERLSRYLDAGAQFMVAAMMFVTTANVVTRRVFGAPIKGTVEFVQLLTALAVGLGVAHCAVHGGHIAITFFTDMLSKKFQRIISIFIDLLVALFLGLSSWQLFIYGENMRLKGEISLTTGMSVYPLVYVVALGFALYLLVVLLGLAKTLRDLFGPKNTANTDLNVESEFDLEQLVN